MRGIDAKADEQTSDESVAKKNAKLLSFAALINFTLAKEEGSDAEEFEELGGGVEGDREIAEVVIVRPDRHAKFQRQSDDVNVIGITMLDHLASLLDVGDVVGFGVALNRQDLDRSVERVEIEFVEIRELLGVIVHLGDCRFGRGDDQVRVVEHSRGGAASDRGQQNVAIGDDAF